MQPGRVLATDPGLITSLYVTNSIFFEVLIIRNVKHLPVAAVPLRWPDTRYRQ